MHRLEVRREHRVTRLSHVTRDTRVLLRLRRRPRRAIVRELMHVIIGGIAIVIITTILESNLQRKRFIIPYQFRRFRRRLSLPMSQKSVILYSFPLLF